MNSVRFSEWEVFVQPKTGVPFQHAGNVHAADKEMAIQNARDLYTRRMEGTCIWVVKTEDIVSMDLKVGEISLHDNQLLHGSGPNHSDKIRAGQTMRFCPTEVKCDLNVWPKFESYLVRGVDKFKHTTYPCVISNRRDMTFSQVADKVLFLD